VSLDIYFKQDDRIVHEVNITHNLARMARHADLYDPLWAPPYGVQADLMRPAWAHGARNLRLDPAKFQAMNPSNGWGTYEDLLVAVDGLIEASIRWPRASVVVSV
jgi:hypothetical protein